MKVKNNFLRRILPNTKREYVTMKEVVWVFLSYPATMMAIGCLFYLIGVISGHVPSNHDAKMEVLHFLLPAGIGVGLMNSTIMYSIWKKQQLK